jgi:hypothetical protein
MVYLTFIDSELQLAHGTAGLVLHFHAPKPLIMNLNPDGSLIVKGIKLLFPYNKG